MHFSKGQHSEKSREKAATFFSTCCDDGLVEISAQIHPKDFFFANASSKGEELVFFRKKKKRETCKIMALRMTIKHKCLVFGSAM